MDLVKCVQSIVLEEGRGCEVMIKTRSSAVAETARVATLRVIEYFAKSLKVIQNDTVYKYVVCKSLLVFH